MVIGRLAGDRLVARFGVVAVVRLGSALAAAALAAGLVARTTSAGGFAFGAVGLGVAAPFPAMFSAAGTLPGQGVAAMSTAARPGGRGGEPAARPGGAAMSTAARTGFPASPPVVGAVADHGR
jgi:hypothetical protein